MTRASQAREARFFSSHCHRRSLPPTLRLLPTTALRPPFTLPMHATQQPSTMLKLPRPVLLGAIALFTLWGFYLGGGPALRLGASSVPASLSLLGQSRPTQSPLSPHVHTYFEQAFSPETPAPYSFPAITAACARTEWKPENRDVYLRCGGMAAGMTSILSQVKVCFKMAIDAGVHVVLPAMPLRDSDDLTNFNFLNASAYLPYEEWFDVEHLTASMGRVCPRMKIRRAQDMHTPTLPVSREWNVDIATAPGYVWLAGYFWVGRPFRVWFEGELRKLREAADELDNDDKVMSRQEDDANNTDLAASRKEEEGGATIVLIASQFLIYRITDDATGRDLRLWNDISHLVRFRAAPRELTAKVLARMAGRPFIGLHFRVEDDNIWSSFETQLRRGVDILDTIWTPPSSGGRGGDAAAEAQRPLVYLACGDEGQIARFVDAARPRGWTVTSKYDLVADDAAARRQLTDLPFDFQGLVDMGVMLQSHFFVGVSGSAFSSTVANMRDVTGRYRGSSLLDPDDANARTHLFNDGDAASYPCCL